MEDAEKLKRGRFIAAIGLIWEGVDATGFAGMAMARGASLVTVGLTGAAESVVVMGGGLGGTVTAIGAGAGATLLAGEAVRAGAGFVVTGGRLGGIATAIDAGATLLTGEAVRAGAGLDGVVGDLPWGR